MAPLDTPEIKSSLQEIIQYAQPLNLDQECYDMRMYHVMTSLINIRYESNFKESYIACIYLYRYWLKKDNPKQSGNAFDVRVQIIRSLSTEVCDKIELYTTQMAQPKMDSDFFDNLQIHASFLLKYMTNIETLEQSGIESNLDHICAIYNVPNIETLVASAESAIQAAKHVHLDHPHPTDAMMDPRITHPTPIHYTLENPELQRDVEDLERHTHHIPTTPSWEYIDPQSEKQYVENLEEKMDCLTIQGDNNIDTSCYGTKNTLNLYDNQMEH